MDELYILTIPTHTFTSQATNTAWTVSTDHAPDISTSNEGEGERLSLVFFPDSEGS